MGKEDASNLGWGVGSGKRGGRLMRAWENMFKIRGLVICKRLMIPGAGKQDQRIQDGIGE